MIKDPKKEYKEEMQEVMLELYIKTDKFLKKLKEETKGPEFDLNQKNSDNHEA